jgi:hypothetical protein
MSPNDSSGSAAHSELVWGLGMLGFDMVKSGRSQKDGTHEEIKLITSTVSISYHT